MDVTFKQYVDNVNAFYDIRTPIDMLEIEYINWRIEINAKEVEQ
jgi:hypothetical protein